MAAITLNTDGQNSSNIANLYLHKWKTLVRTIITGYRRVQRLEQDQDGNGCIMIRTTTRIERLVS